MAAYAPLTHLETHDVTNTPPPFAGRNLYHTDIALRDAARLYGGDWVEEPLASLGKAAGSEEVLQWGEDANRYVPELQTFDRFGRRIDEVKFHPAYHKLMALAMEHRIHDIAWLGKGQGSHVAQAAMVALVHAGGCRHDVPDKHDLRRCSRVAASSQRSRALGWRKS